MKFKETAIPQVFVTELAKLNLGWDQLETVEAPYKTLFASMADYLRIVKQQHERVAVVIENESNEFVMAALVTKHENENPDMPPNYSFEITFDGNDVNGAHVTKLQDPVFDKVVVETARNLCYMNFNEAGFSFKVMLAVATSLKEWLTTNATVKEVSVELDGYFVGSAIIEDGKPCISCVPSGELKRLIKGDESLQQ